QAAHDQLHCRLFAVENRAVGLQKVPLTRGTVELTPGAATGMTVGPEIATPAPASVLTTGMRTKVQRGVDCTGASVGRCHGVGRYRRGRLGMRGLSLTQGTRGLVRQPLKGFGLVGAVALGLARLGLGWSGRNRHRALGPGEMQDDEKPNECEQDELREKKMRLHDVTPSNMC